MADRWYALTQTDVITASKYDTPYIYNRSCVKVLQPQVAAQRCGICQILPYMKSVVLRGRDIIIQAAAFNGFGGNVRMSLLWWTGATDAVTSDIVNDWTSSTYTTGNFFASTNLVLIKTQATAVGAGWLNLSMIVSAAEMGSSSGTFLNLILMIHPEDAGAQNAAFYVGNVDLFNGTATRSALAKDPAHELQECQRYQCVFGGNAGYQRVCLGQAQGVGSDTLFMLYLPVTMRGVPTVSYSALADWWVGAAATSIAINSSGPDAVCLGIQPGAVAGSLQLLLANNTSNARIWLRSEL